ncbi:MAG: hypothetical protein RL115_2324 [Bacteroidota bacterium]|jgi:uncharacterized membrane protein YhhN
MKPLFWIYLFLFVLALNLAGATLSTPWLGYCTKPLLIPIVALYFLSFKEAGASRHLKMVVLFALLFSWLGDVLLMFVPKNENFFLAGLASFLFAHIFYIFFFIKIKAQEKLTNRIWIVALVVLYYGGLIYLLSPYLGEMKLPVRIYGLVISFMCMLALHLFYLSPHKRGWQMAVGALLFVVSDSILAINKFYAPFEMAGFCIMFTYGMAQLFIVKGVGEYISSK